MRKPPRPRNRPSRPSAKSSHCLHKESSMDNSLQVFQSEQFGSVRTLDEDGKVYFCGADTAKSLGYKRPKDAIAAHCKGAVKRRTLTNGGMQELLFIPEGDLYRLITHSRLLRRRSLRDGFSMRSYLLSAGREHIACTPARIRCIRWWKRWRGALTGFLSASTVYLEELPTWSRLTHYLCQSADWSRIRFL